MARPTSSYELLWLPRGRTTATRSAAAPFSLAPGAGVRYANVLDEVFGLAPDRVGALAVEASGSRPAGDEPDLQPAVGQVAGTYGQELPGIPADRMIPAGVKNGSSS